jgi:hypothetical protein
VACLTAIPILKSKPVHQENINAHRFRKIYAITSALAPEKKSWRIEILLLLIRELSNLSLPAQYQDIACLSLLSELNFKSADIIQPP